MEEKREKRKEAFSTCHGQRDGERPLICKNDSGLDEFS